MGQFHGFWKVSAAVLLSAGLLWGSVSHAQTKPATMPDAQIEASVLKALAGAPELADQSITSTTVYGVVTLNGTVRDEPLRDLAEHLVANTAGVQKVVDQLVVSASPAAVSNEAQQGASNPNLQSDGTVAPPQGSAQTAPAPSSQYPPPPPQGGQYPQPYPSQPGQYPQPYPSQPGQYPQPYPSQAGQYPPPYPAQPGQYPPQYGQPYPPPYQPPYVPQKGGDAVVVPSGTILRVRINQALSSKNAVQGSTFDGVVLSNVYAGNQIAIPRGATFQGVVADAHPAAQLSGKGELKLQVTNVTFGGKTYPIATDFWWHQGPSKTANTVGNTVGLAGVGAVIGGIAGGGVGAAVGAGVGGVAGLGVSSASKVGEASLPSEAIVSFHLTQPADVTTVSQAELNRLGAGIPQVPQQMNPRYPPPPPGYPYYGPGYYYPR
jgi:BON domain